MAKKFKLPKFKRLKKSKSKRTRNPRSKSQKKKLIKKAVQYLVLLTLSIFFTIVAFVSLPLTEKVISTVNFDLTAKTYTSKSYILELKIKTEDKALENLKIKQTSRIISKRLYKAGAQQVSITGYHSADVTPDDSDYLYRYIQIRVKAPFEESVMDQFVKTRNYLRFYSAKEDVNFNDDKNPYVAYLPTSYNASDITRHDLRTIYFKPLDNGDGTTTYNAIFKEKFFNHDFRNFVIANAGKKIGIGIDGGIIPIDIPIDYSKEYREASNTNTFVFALGLTDNADDAKVYDLLFNSGVIPLEYNVTDESLIDSPSPNISHIKLALTFLTAVIAFAIFNILVMKKPAKKVLQSSTSLLLTFAIYISYLKFFIIPVDLGLLYITSLLFVLSAFINTMRSYDNNDYFITLAILFMAWIMAFGIIKELAFSLLTLMTLYIIVKELVRYYLDNMISFINND